MMLRIFGPNLNDQSKGDLHVHAASCGDCKHYGPNGKFGGDAFPGSREFASAMEVSAYIYGDHLSDHGLTVDDAEGVEMLDDWLTEFWFAPCTKGLPHSTEQGL